MSGAGRNCLLQKYELQISSCLIIIKETPPSLKATRGLIKDRDFILLSPAGRVSKCSFKLRGTPTPSVGSSARPVLLKQRRSRWLQDTAGNCSCWFRGC